VEGRERELLRGKNQMRERGRGHASRVWAPGRAGLGRGPGWKPTTHTTTDRNPIANRNLKQGETNTQLNTTRDKRNMLRHDATHMST
jgi:hypothetical protein